MHFDAKGRDSDEGSISSPTYMFLPSLSLKVAASKGLQPNEENLHTDRACVSQRS